MIDMVKSHSYQMQCPCCLSWHVKRIPQSFWYCCDDCKTEFIEEEYNTICPFLIHKQHPDRDVCGIEARRVLCPHWEYSTCQIFLTHQNPDLPLEEEPCDEEDDPEECPISV